MEGNFVKKYSDMDELVNKRKNLFGGGSGFILGASDSGKTLAAKLQIRSVLDTTNDEVIVIDTDGEYVSMAEQLDGQIIKITNGGNFYINPFDMKNKNGTLDSIAIKKDFIMSMIKASMGEEFSMVPSQQSLLERCIRHVYWPYIGSENKSTGEYDKTKLPTLKYLYDCVREQSGFDAFDLADIIKKSFLGASAEPFLHTTNFEHKKRFVVYDLSECRCLEPVVQVMIVTEHIWTCYVNSAGRLLGGPRAWLFIDDVSDVLRNNGGLEWFKWLCKQSRSHNCSFTGVACTVYLPLHNDKLCSLLVNSAYLHLPKQLPLELKIFAQLLDLSPSQVSFLEEAAANQALIIWGDGEFTEISQNFSVKKTYSRKDVDEEKLRMLETTEKNKDVSEEHLKLYLVVADISFDYRAFPYVQKSRGTVLWDSNSRVVVAENEIEAELKFAKNHSKTEFPWKLWRRMVEGSLKIMCCEPNITIKTKVMPIEDKALVGLYLNRMSVKDFLLLCKQANDITAK